MLERRRARKTWVLGLIVILCSYNLAYANVKLSGNTAALPAKERTNTLNDDGATKTLTTDTTKTVPPNKKNVSNAKHTANAANSCACSCSAKTGRAAATPGPWWDCLKGCLRSWGVSVVQLILCGGSCVAGIIPLCALCLGVDASFFMLCANGCAVYTGGFDTGDGHVPILTRKTPHKNRKNADRRVSAFAARK